MAQITLGAVTELNLSTHLDPMFTELYQLRSLFFTGTGNVLGLGLTPSAWDGFAAIEMAPGASFAATTNGPYINQNMYWDGTNWKLKAAGAAIQVYMASGTITVSQAASGSAGATASLTTRSLLDASGNKLRKLTATPPALTENLDMVMNLTSNTNLRISVRGSDGTTRVANITLA